MTTDNEANIVGRQKLRPRVLANNAIRECFESLTV